MAKMRKSAYTRQSTDGVVWVGYSDGVPHLCFDDIEGKWKLSVYATRADAEAAYEDARRMRLIPAPISRQKGCQ